MSNADVVTDLSGVDTFDVALVLGSGWGGALDRVGTVTSVCPTARLEGFVASSAPGHSGQVFAIDADGVNVLAFSGRTHVYEGHGVDPVVAPVRLAHALGCRTVVLTNGAGAANPSFRPGDVVMLTDHINNLGVSALVGAQFVDMIDAYSPRLRSLVAPLVDRQGVYMANRGPAYETPAEVRMAMAMGADLVGMSTVLEATVARSLGLEVLGLTLVTNMAAGLSSSLDHQEVLAVGAQSAERLGSLLAEVVRLA